VEQPRLYSRESLLLAWVTDLGVLEMNASVCWDKPHALLLRDFIQECFGDESWSGEPGAKRTQVRQESLVDRAWRRALRGCEPE
jgi:hypothetical protein